MADYALVSADRCLDLGSHIVLAGFLPRHAAPFGGHLQVAVALRRGALGRSTHNRACPWRHDDRSVWMMLGHRLADPVLIVIAVDGEGSDGIGDLVEQSVNHRAIIDFFLGYFDGDDLAAAGIHTDMQLSPGSAAGRAVLFNQPLAGATKLQAGAVDQQMKRAGSRPLERR